jgi:glycosyltransferase involved in cell wall biosynthesis
MEPYLSVVIPLYNEEKNISPLYKILRKVLKKIGKSYEIIFVDDGSKDNSLEELLKVKSKDRNVKIIQFQRNFGKAAGLNAAFKEASGEIVITMDADLQDRPEELPKLITKLNQGYDLVSGWKYKRYDSIGKRFPSKIMNFIARLISGAKIHDFNCGLKAYRKEVVKNIELYGDLHRYIPALAHWKGYSVGEVKVVHKKRMYGKSKYGFVRLMGAFDLVTIRFLNIFAKRPLHFFGPIGLLSLLVGSIMGLYLAFLWLKGLGIGNRPLLFLSILLIVVGVQFISLGLLGEMITNIGKKDDYIIKKKY